MFATVLLSYHSESYPTIRLQTYNKKSEYGLYSLNNQLITYMHFHEDIEAGEIVSRTPNLPRS